MGSIEVEELEDPESLEERFPKTRQRSRRIAAVNLHPCVAEASYLYGYLTKVLKLGCRGNVLSVAVYDLPESGWRGIRMSPFGKNVLRYYYAVFEFDSIATADTIYRIVDGPCIHGPIVFDLRFIPDSVEFNSQPHDIAPKPAESELESLARRGSGSGDVEEANVVENLNQSTNGLDVNACVKGFALDSTNLPIKSTKTYPRKVALKKRKRKQKRNREEFVETEPIREISTSNIAGN